VKEGLVISQPYGGYSNTHYMLSTTLFLPGVRMEQRSRSKFLPRPGFEPRTSNVAVQHATVRPPRTSNSWQRKLNFLWTTI